MNHALGKNKMTATQIKAAEILLRKAIPDLRTVEHSGEVTQTIQHIGVSALRARLAEFVGDGSGADSDRPAALPH